MIHVKRNQHNTLGTAPFMMQQAMGISGSGKLNAATAA